MAGFERRVLALRFSRSTSLAGPGMRSYLRALILSDEAAVAWPSVSMRRGGESFKRNWKRIQIQREHISIQRSGPTKILAGSFFHVILMSGLEKGFGPATQMTR